MHEADPKLELTALLKRCASDPGARNAALEAIYPQLRAMANKQLGHGREGFTLRPTELAHEAFLRMHDQRSTDWASRTQFFAIAATLVRRVVIDYLRKRGAQKRGTGTPFVSLDEISEKDHPVIDDRVDWLQVDEALTALAAEDAAMAQVVELKFFSGMKIDEIAAAMGSSEATVGRQWRFAKAYLTKRLGDDGV